MFLSCIRSPQTVFRLAACLLLAAGSGCGWRPPWSHVETGPLLESVKVSELRPGCYCEIEMVIPPTASEGSFDCYKGTVKEVNHDEVVLTDVVEESCIEYGTTSRHRPPTQDKRELVHVPLTGVDEIWALPPAKGDATGNLSAAATEGIAHHVAFQRRATPCRLRRRLLRQRQKTLEVRPVQPVFRRPCRQPRRISMRR